MPGRRSIRIRSTAISWEMICLMLIMGCQPAAPVTTPPVKTATPLPTSSEPKTSEASPDSALTPRSAVEPITTPPLPPAVVFRPSDLRPQPPWAELEQLGIRRYESQRLVLVTDIEPELAAPLPRLVDQLYDALVEEFGPMPPDREGTEFQMTGYLMRDVALFRETQLIPEDLPRLDHGRHRANEFWLRDQTFDYYRRHLMLHEATHAFMTFMPDTRSALWYLEGMAEVFGTHEQRTDGNYDFGVMPRAPEDVPGWGRVTIVRDEYAAMRAKSIHALFDYVPNDFSQNPPYAWSWALTHFLRQHPRYKDRFLQLGRTARGRTFNQTFGELYDPDHWELEAEWGLFVVNLQYGYDVPRAAIDFIDGDLLDMATTANCSITADRGWQSSRVLVEQGNAYQITATGEVTLAEGTRPWISEPDGISIDYADGEPVGKLLACIRDDDTAQTESMLHVLPIARSRRFRAPISGTLYLRINDRWDRLADNRGRYRVQVERMAETAE
jgi:hypothetical protein